MRFWCKEHQCELVGPPHLYDEGGRNFVVDTSEMDCPIAIQEDTHGCNQHWEVQQ